MTRYHLRDDETHERFIEAVWDLMAAKGRGYDIQSATTLPSVRALFREVEPDDLTRRIERECDDLDARIGPDTVPIDFDLSGATDDDTPAELRVVAQGSGVATVKPLDPPEWDTPTPPAESGPESFAESFQRNWKANEELRAENASLRATVERLEGENDQLRQDRYDASRDGLLASEWVARTGKAERERDAFRADAAAFRALMDTYNLGGWTDAAGPMRRALEVEAENAALRAEVARLREDGERIDWLESHPGMRVYFWPSDGSCGLWTRDSLRKGDVDLRQAIDAVRLAASAARSTPEGDNG